MNDERQAKQLFQQAIEKPPEARKAFLDRVCGHAALRRRVEVLLEAYEDLDDFLASPTVGAEAPTEGPGTVIGPYKLLQRIGEGGFGVVYMAEQLEPVRRRVALKVIKLGMDTRQVVARFEAERQALAMMEHPNIAKVFDAGATDTGRPYFVMELVKGVSITEYCDQAQLDTRERLDLFVEVCHAIQHAHQKGIIHRDIKPGNVLITLHDGRPVPRVIDFGIAKATQSRLTEKTLFTEFHQMIGTPDYMAPEQAEMSGLDIDTRADVYSLGVLLYEILTGTRPFDLRTLMERGYGEILRTIREVDPPCPSTRLSTMGDLLATVARQRHTAPRLLGRLLRGDLDWIVMRALEKDRSRRYESANGLAMDIRRHLDDEPVRATPPGAGFRARKYLRRHRAAVVAATVILGALVAGGGIAYSGRRKAETETRIALAAEAERSRQRDATRTARAREQQQRERSDAETARAEEQTARADTVLEFIGGMVRGGGLDATLGELLDAFDRDLGDRFRGRPRIEAQIRTTMGNSYRGLGLLAKAEVHAKAALDAARSVPGGDDDLLGRCVNNMAIVLQSRGEYEGAEGLHCESLAILRKSLGTDHPNVAGSLNNLGMVLHSRGDYAGAEGLFRESLAISRKALGADHPDVAASLGNLGAVLNSRGDYAGAEGLFRESLAICRKSVGADHPDVATSLNNLGSVLQSRGDYQGAEGLFRESLAIRRKSLGADHPDVAMSLHNLGGVLQSRGDHAGAEGLYRESLAIYRKSLGADHPDVATSLNNLGSVLQSRGDGEGAEGLFRESLAIRRKSVGVGHPDVARSLNNLGLLLQSRGDYASAEGLLRESLAIWRKSLGANHPDVAASLGNLGSVLHSRGDYAGAEGLLRESLAIWRKSLGADHPDVAASLNNLGVVLQSRGDYEGAEGFYRESLAIWRKSLGESHPTVVRSLENLAHVLLSRKVFPSAELVCRELLTRERSHSRLALLGNCLLAQAKHAEAETVLRECLALREREMANHWLRYNAMSMLGGALAGQRQYAEAEPLVVEGYEKMAPPAPSAQEKREALERVVSLYEAWGDAEKAAEWRGKLCAEEGK